MIIFPGLLGAIAASFKNLFSSITWNNESILYGSLATGSSDNFGFSVATNSTGDRVIIGAYNDEADGGIASTGLAYIFVSGAGGWSQQHILSGSLATGSNDNFGISVAMNSTGDRVIVGALSDERVGLANAWSEGLAYIFVSGTNGWMEQQILSGSYSASFAEFGKAVAINSIGDVAAVGGGGTALAHVYVSGAGGWIQQHILSGSFATGSGDTSVDSISINSVGDRIIVGAWTDERSDQLNSHNEGLAYIFVSGAGGWTQQQILSGTLATGSADTFGISVAMNSTGDRVIVGATGDEAVGANASSGLAYIFVSGAGGWTQQHILSGSFATGSGDIFGGSVAINSTGDRVIVGARLDEAVDAITSTGLAYIFVSGAGGWTQQQILSGSFANGTSDFFGNAVAMSSTGERIVVGARQDERASELTSQNEGLAYIYNSNITQIVNNFIYSINSSSINFGDLGTASFPQASSQITLTVPSGYLYSPMNDVATITVSSSVPGTYTVNLSNLTITPAFGGTNTNITATYVPTTSGEITGLITISASIGTNYVSLTGSAKIERWLESQILSGSLATGSSDFFGDAVAINSAGDRIIIAARQDERASELTSHNEGLAYIFVSGAGGWTQQQILSGTLATGSLDTFGISVAMNSAGDRVIVGAYFDERASELTSHNEGLAYIFVSGAGGWTQQQILSGTLATGSDDRFGQSVAINSTGDRVIVGAPLDEAVGANAGSGLAYMFVSGAGGWTQQQILSGSFASGSNAQFGWSVAISSIGDRIAVGARQDRKNITSTAAGLAYIFISGAVGWTQQEVLSGSFATGSLDSFGSTIAMNSSGDRVILGVASDERPSQLSTHNEGLAYIFVSGAGGWTQQEILSGTLATGSGDSFGQSVAINSTGDRVIVGANQDESVSAAGSSGLAYIFVSGAGGWSQYQILSGSFATEGADSFGASVAINSAGDRVIVGATSDEAVGGINASGLAYVSDLKIL